jgi:hypothetical protein
VNYESSPIPQDQTELLPTPKQSLEFDKEKAEVWVEAESDPEIRAIKRKIIDNIQHISFSEFKEKSEGVISQALQELSESNQKYAVFFDYKPHSSKRWVYEINKKCYSQYPPTEIRHFTPAWEKMSGNNRLRKIVEGGVNTFLISDDAAYSGEQIINKQIEPIIKFYEAENIQQRPKFVLAIPFVTSRFLKLVEEMKAKYGCEIVLHTNSIMPSLAELLTADEVKTLNERRNGNLELAETEPTYLGATVTCFDHRVADDHSFSGEVRKALSLSAEKPYADDSTEYFKQEAQEFEEYKKTVFPT